CDFQHMIRTMKVSPASAKAAYDSLLARQLEWMHAAEEDLAADSHHQAWIEARNASHTLAQLHEHARQYVKEWMLRLNKKSPHRMQELMLSCMDYIKEHFREELSLEGLSAQFHFNPSYFSQQFKRFTGKKLSDYIMDVR